MLLDIVFSCSDRRSRATRPWLNFTTFVVATLAGRTRGPARERVWVLLKMPISAYYCLLKTVVSEGQNFSVMLEKRFWAAALKANSDAGFASKTEKIGT